MTISAADVKKLRDATGAGMMDAKRALKKPTRYGQGDRAPAHQGRRPGREAADRSADNGACRRGRRRHDPAQLRDGLRREGWRVPAAGRGHLVACGEDATVERCGAARGDARHGKTVAENLEAANAVIGEKIELGNVVVFDGTVTAYMHKRASDLPAQIGVLVEFDGDDVETARAWPCRLRHCARSTSPAGTFRRSSSPGARDRRGDRARGRQAGAGVAENRFEGRVNGFFKDAVLVEQAYVRDNKKTVQAVLDGAGVNVEAVRPLRGRGLTPAIG